MQTFRSVCQEVAVLMHGAALHQRVGPDQPEHLLQPRRAVDDDEIRRPQAAGDEVIKQTPPGRLAHLPPGPADRVLRYRALTPGREQANNILRAFGQALRAGAPLDVALRDAKLFGSFSGPMRSNIV